MWSLWYFLDRQVESCILERVSQAWNISISQLIPPSMMPSRCIGLELMEILVNPFEIHLTTVYIRKIARGDLSFLIQSQMGVMVMCLWNELLHLNMELIIFLLVQDWQRARRFKPWIQKRAGLRHCRISRHHLKWLSEYFEFEEVVAALQPATQVERT